MSTAILQSLGYVVVPAVVFATFLGLPKLDAAIRAKRKAAKDAANDPVPEALQSTVAKVTAELAQPEAKETQEVPMQKFVTTAPTPVVATIAAAAETPALLESTCDATDQEMHTPDPAPAAEKNWTGFDPSKFVDPFDEDRYFEM
ncbi:hypothetical protein F6X40_10870 [Paraburkholderia sp. UCT31]|uniref:hypothetical protein n=1 Tax=Paraburkholderia sp. UCT31 TaxID=2615209 RepID=UPI00165560E9|nr:hypothetical protein [Paraburkholderia sp. UCT31]MBC8737309.1 hypothetical protein [Paraburkholderia sp. UCT31]